MRYPFLLTLSLLLSFPPAALAQDYATTRKSIQGFYGFSVNSFSGNLHYSRTDLFVPGRGLSLDFTFYYNSSESSDNFGSGLGWSHSYDMTMSEDSMGVITLRRAGGRSHQYTRVGGDIVSAQGVYDEVDEPSPGVFRLTSKNGMEYHFEGVSHPGLTRIRDRFGNEMTLSYEDGHLASVTDVGGRTAALTYNDDGLVTEIRMVNTDPERWVYYGYEGEYLTSVTDAEGYQLIYGYTGGRLTSMQDKNGNPLNIGYSPFGAVTAMRTCSGEKKFDYNSTLSTTSVVEKVRDTYQKTSYVFENGRLIEEIGNCCGFRTQYDYDANGNVSKVTDANGNATLYFYDDRGNMIQETNALGDSRYMTYDPEFNQVTSSTDWKGNTTSMYFSEMGLLDSIVKPLGVTYQYQFDEAGQLVRLVDARGNEAILEYDSNGQVSTATNSSGISSFVYYDGLSQLVKAASSDGVEVDFVYDLVGRLISKSHSYGVRQYEYDASGNCIVQINELGHEYAMIYDEWDRLQEVVDPVGNVNSIERDENGNVILIKNKQGGVKRFVRDEMNRIVEVVNPLGNSTYYEYDQGGNNTGVLLPNGNLVHYTYDQLDRLVGISDHLGNIEIIDYDENSSIISTMDGDGFGKLFAYDSLGRMIESTNAAGGKSTYQYDENGNLLRFTDAVGKWEGYEYDELNRLATKFDSLGVLLGLEYDARGNVRSVVDGLGNVTEFSYDDLGNVIAIVFDNGDTIAYEYDAASQLVMLRNGGVDSLFYAYNSIGLVVNCWNAGGDVSSVFEYDDNGRLVSAIADSDTVLFVRDGVGRVLSEFGVGGSVSHVYDDVNSQVIEVLPGGIELKREYNLRGELVALIGADNVPLFEQEFTDGGRRFRRNWAAQGFALEYGYDDGGWVKEIIEVQLDAFSLSLDRNLAGKIVRETLESDEIEERVFKYDVRGRLDSVSLSSTGGDVLVEECVLFYDLADNITRLEKSNDVRDFDINCCGQLDVVVENGDSIEVTYDSRGNLIDDGFCVYVYDGLNRLKLQVCDEDTVVSRYDAIGRRVEQSVGDSSFISIWDGYKKIGLIDDGDVAFLLLQDDLDDFIGNLIDGTLTPVVQDMTRNVRFAKDDEGDFRVLSFDVFGDSASEGTGTGVDVGYGLGYAGTMKDMNESLLSMRNRDYSVRLGRFMQRDPMGFIDGANVYLYASGDPVNSWDPLGFFAIPGGYGCNECSSGEDSPLVPNNDMTHNLTGADLVREKARVYSKYDVMNDYLPSYNGNTIFYTNKGKPYVVDINRSGKRYAKFLSSKNANRAIRSAAAKQASHLSALDKIGCAGSVLSTGVDAVGAWENPSIGNFADLGVSGLGAVASCMPKVMRGGAGPVGMCTLGYGVADYFIEYYSGKDIGDHVNEKVDAVMKPVYEEYQRHEDWFQSGAGFDYFSGGY